VRTFKEEPLSLSDRSKLASVQLPMTRDKVHMTRDKVHMTLDKVHRTLRFFFFAWPPLPPS
jgi:hypothetical protein